MLYNPSWEIETTIAKDPWRVILWEAAGWLRQHGHCRGRFINPNDGTRCALGAIHAITVEGKHYSPTNAIKYWVEAIVQLKRRVGIPIADWNDANTAETVISTLESVALS